MQTANRLVSRAVAAGASALALVAACVGASVAPAASAPTPVDIRPGPDRQPEVVPGEVLVTYRPGIARAKAELAKRSVGGKVIQAFPGRALERLRLAPSVTVEAALNALKAHPAVAHAQPNFVYRKALNANDPGFADGSLWGLHNYGQTGGTPDADVDAPEAWNLSTGSANVVVGVIDTGIDYTHPDLAANVWTNPGEIAGNGLDDDKNGYVDDVHGWDARNNDGNPIDDEGHGTHVAGTIGAVGNNGVGVAGVNWNVKMVALKFLGADGSGSTAGAIACLDYAHKLKDRGINIIATNNSWGGGGYDQLLKDAIERSNARGMLFVAAAGNGDYWGNAINNDSSPQYPASYNNANIIAVTATNRNDVKASWANYGATSVDLGAPGVDIVSTTPGNTYSSYSGTSMATPQVTGAVALLKAYAGTLTHLQLRDRVIQTGDYCQDLDGKTASGRRLNLSNALTNTVPAKPAKQEMTVTVTTNKSSYRFGQYVYITVRATNRATGGGIGGASVNMTVRTPYGYVHSGSGTADANGNITFRYYPKKSYGKGWYQATAAVSATGYNSGNGGPTAFYVY